MFTDVPVLEASIGSDGALTFIPGRGSAVLLTDDCQLDKRTGSAKRPKVSRLQFAPLHDMESANLEADLRDRLLRGELNPPEMIYVSNIGDDRQAVGLLGEAYPIPAVFFGLEIQNFAGHLYSDPDDPNHLVATRNDSRILTAEEGERRLLKQKLAFYWTHFKLPDPSAAP